MTTLPLNIIPANEGYPVGRDVLTGPVIITRYLGPTNHLGSRVVATHRHGPDTVWRAVVSWDYALDATENHHAAASQLLRKWITCDDLVIVGRGHDHDAYYWLVAGLWQLES